jgi:S1-C subfamily serine protease
LRTVGEVGIEVLRVDPESAAGRAGLQPGDVITAAADIEAPSASELMRLYAASPDTAPVLVVVARGENHRVVALEKKP